jgi:hypothetical protein
VNEQEERKWFTDPRFTVTLSYTEMELLHNALAVYVDSLTKTIDEKPDDEMVQQLVTGCRAESAELRQRLVMIAGGDLTEG